MTLGGNPETEMLPVIACFFAIFGLVFVDLLRWFSLPPIAAYLSLGCIAFYSIGRLMETGTGIADELQMVVVAELLVLVQAVLMIQRKNRRIYEQLAIFCLLELIVASIFNDAISYGLILLPLGFVGAGALALLQTHGTLHEAFTDGSLDDDDTKDFGQSNASKNQSKTDWVQISSYVSTRSFRLAGLKLPRVTMLIFAPSVLVIALLFFYGLPRTSVASSSSSGRVLVGFSESVRLSQIGKMLQSDAVALRAELVDRKTGKPYSIIGNLYLRGAVLETYNSIAGTEGNWSSLDPRVIWPTGMLPAVPLQRASWPGDEVRVRITAEPSSSGALFAIAPYHRMATTSDVRHTSDRWLLSRYAMSDFGLYTKINYQFATTAFRDTRQSKYTPRWDDMVFPASEDPDTDSFEPETVGPHGERIVLRSRLLPASAQGVRRISRFEADQYVRKCLEYDEYRIPSAVRTSDTIASTFGPNPLHIANAIEQHLVSRAGYTYSLNLNSREVPGMDPIEQFMSVHKQGNCQFFASAMVFMLRSQGIPARLVVGYSTDEFNSIGGFFVARQLHAHAWVEALIDSKWIPEEERYFYDEGVDATKPSPDSHGYWVRFDPTPGGGGVGREDSGRVSDVFQLAQNFWSDYVVDRNPKTTQRSELGFGGNDAVVSQYQSMFRWLDMKLSQIRAGQLGGGALAIGKGFSWSAAIFGAALTIFIVAVLQIRMPKSWWRRRKQRIKMGEAAMPKVPFFLETIELLQRVGIRRQPSETPLEFTDAAAQKLAQDSLPSVDSPLRTLTDAFYDTRFSSGTSPTVGGERTPEEVASALRVVRERIELIESGSSKLSVKQ